MKAHNFSESACNLSFAKFISISTMRTTREEREKLAIKHFLRRIQQAIADGAPMSLTSMQDQWRNLVYRFGIKSGGGPHGQYLSQEARAVGGPVLEAYMNQMDTETRLDHNVSSSISHGIKRTQGFIDKAYERGDQYVSSTTANADIQRGLAFKMADCVYQASKKNVAEHCDELVISGVPMEEAMKQRKLGLAAAKKVRRSMKKAALAAYSASVNAAKEQVEGHLDRMYKDHAHLIRLGGERGRNFDWSSEVPQGTGRPFPPYSGM
jgi:hypothetical protein